MMRAETAQAETQANAHKETQLAEMYMLCQAVAHAPMQLGGHSCDQATPPKSQLRRGGSSGLSSGARKSELRRGSGGGKADALAAVVKDGVERAQEDVTQDPEGACGHVNAHEAADALLLPPGIHLHSLRQAD